MMRKNHEKQYHQKLWCLLLLFLGTISVSKCSYDGRQPYFYFKDHLMFLGSNFSHQMASSIVLPIYGNVYPRGFYYVRVDVGDPPRPYFLDPDTGSDLTWLQCDAPCVRCSKAPHPLYKPSKDLIPARDPLCAAIQPNKCEKPEQCDYEVEYADGGSSLGVLLRDSLHFKLTNGLTESPRLAIGCGYDQIPGSSDHPLDGVLGLGKGKVSIVSQLSDQGLTRNVVGHCLSGRGGGYIFFGDQIYDSSRLVWTKSIHDYKKQKHYSPGFAKLIYGQKSTGVKNLAVIFDSGSSYTYFASQAYHTLVSQLTRDLHTTSLKEATNDDTLPLCWKGTRPFKNIHDVRQYFKPLALSFVDRSKYPTRFDIPPENYLIISRKGSVCLGILNGAEVGLQNYNIIGDVSMQDKMIIYDNEKTMIGWGSANCDKIPKGKVASF